MWFTCGWFTCGEERGLMEFWIFFVKGVIAGFIIAMPVGPVAIMCVHRTLVQGTLYGYISGLGAATGDTVFGAIAAFGLGFLADDLMAHNEILRFIGGAILCLLGIRAVLTRRLPNPAADDRRSYLGDGASAFFVTVTNPITLISFAAVLAGLNIHGVTDHLRWSVSLTWGVFTGACLWWFLLTTVTRSFRGFMTDARLLWVTRATGALIILFGVLLLFSLVSIDAETFGERFQRSGLMESAPQSEPL